MTILSVTDLRVLIDISTHKSDLSVEAAIEAVENAYVKKYFKDSVFVYILQNTNVSPTNTFVDLVLNGGIYQDAISPASSYHFNGLNKAITLLAYSYLLMKQTEVTRYGAVNKTDPRSLKPDFSSILEQVSRYRKTALSYLEDIDFMLRNIDETDYNQTIIDLLTAYRLECVGKMEGILNEWI